MSGRVDREARHRVAELVDDRLSDSPVEGQPVYEHHRRASATGNGDATSVRPARTSARSPAWISRTKSGRCGRSVRQQSCITTRARRAVRMAEPWSSDAPRTGCARGAADTCGSASVGGRRL